MRHGGLRLNGINKRSEMEKPLVSVITAVYNGENHLEMTIKSVLGQTYDNIEYIIIDGGSTDGTLDMIKKYENNIDYWISESDRGIADAFNKGIALSTGEIIGIINSDDWYEPDAVYTIINSLKPYPAVYCGQMNLYNLNGDKVVKLYKSRPARLSQTMRVAHPSTFVPRSVYKSVNNFSTEYKIAMDYDLLLKIRAHPFEIVNLNKVLSNMRFGGISADLPAVLKEELKIKNIHMGKKVQHITWYVSCLLIYTAKKWLRCSCLKTRNNAKTN